MPFMPERELNNSGSFIEMFYKHLNDENATMFMENGERCEGKELLKTYKYIFNSPVDWTGPLNYFRNLLFYRVKPNISVR
jgi:epoxide hydrolase 4